jgi:hypothetical protein
MPASQSEWTQTGPQLWHTADGRYAVVVTELPQRWAPFGIRPAEPTVTFTLRCIDAQIEAAYPGTLGYFVTERYSLEEAQGAADSHRYSLEHVSERSVPVDHPAEQVTRFFWPISDGTSRAALALVRDDDGQVRAQVVGLARGDADDRGEFPYRPVVYAEVTVAMPAP